MSLHWKKLKEEPHRTGYRKILRRTFYLPNGIESDFDIKDEGRPVCVLALTEKNEVILAKQFRPGPEEILLELPGGGREKDETPEEAIRRELLEETGYTGDFQFVSTSLDDAYSNLIRHNFVATACRKVQEPQPDEHEFIEVVLMSMSDFREHLRSGRLSDIETGYLCLDFLGLL